MTFSTGIVENHNYNGHLIVWQTKTQDFAFAPKRCLAKILALNWHSWFNTAGYIKGAQMYLDIIASKRQQDNFQHCLLLALLLCFHSSGINKNEQRMSKFTKHSVESESELAQLSPRPLRSCLSVTELCFLFLLPLAQG